MPFLAIAGAQDRSLRKVEQTETKLEVVYGKGRRSAMRGIGLSVNINDQLAHLLLDTGAGGIILSRKVAENAGLTRVSTRHYGGIGDKGLQSGYTAVADHMLSALDVKVDYRDGLVDFEYHPKHGWHFVR